MHTSRGRTNVATGSPSWGLHSIRRECDLAPEVARSDVYSGVGDWCISPDDVSIHLGESGQQSRLRDVAPLLDFPVREHGVVFVGADHIGDVIAWCGVVGAVVADLVEGRV